MKRIKPMSLLLITVSCLALALSGCGKQSDDKGKLEPTDSSKILVAYFSATGNTQKVAEYIAEVTGGTLYEITPEQPYTSGDLNYSDSDSRSTKEQNDPDARPAINGSVENIEKYDVIYLGYPIWHAEAPKIIYTFLESYDLSGKTIVPFCTSASSPLGNSASNLHDLASGANWLSGERFASNAAQSTIEAWLGGLTY